MGGAISPQASRASQSLPAADDRPARFREQFPIFAAQPNLVFFDNASTTQKPESVLRSMSEFYSSHCANMGRASYSWSTQLAAAVEDTREKVAQFLNADNSEIAFTGGATESLNTVALSWGLANLRSGDEVMVCLNDHQSAVLPWFNLQRILANTGIQIHIKPFEIHDVGEYALKSVAETKTDRTKAIAVSHIHHAYGMYMEIQDIRSLVGHDVLISLDASQSAGHTKIDARALNVDFISFSGHKMFASNGIGVLWVHSKLHDRLSPLKVGGKSPVTLVGNEIAWTKAAFPQLFEAGTPNIPGILSLSAAIDFINSYGISQIEERVSELTRYLYDALKDIPGITFARGLGRCGCPRGHGILSFALENIASSDLAFALGNEDIFVRAGDQCISRSEDDDYVRVSLHAYNTEKEIERFVDVLMAFLS